MTNTLGSEFDSYTPEPIYALDGEQLGVRFDVRSLLEREVGPDWQEKACLAVTDYGEVVYKDATDETCREEDPYTRFELLTLDGLTLANMIPGLWRLYRGPFRGMMSATLPKGAEALRVYEEPKDALEFVSQQPADPSTGVLRRMEAHVDQRYNAVLPFDVPASGLEEGRLAIASNPDSRNETEIRDGATFITHRPGWLVCFSWGMKYPHFPEEIKSSLARRIALSLNYPLASESEEDALRLRVRNLGLGLQS